MKVGSISMSAHQSFCFACIIDPCISLANHDRERPCHARTQQSRTEQNWRTGGASSVSHFLLVYLFVAHYLFSLERAWSFTLSPRFHGDKCNCMPLSRCFTLFSSEKGRAHWWDWSITFRPQHFKFCPIECPVVWWTCKYCFRISGLNEKPKKTVNTQWQSSSLLVSKLKGQVHA
jgi:hypothetical protein